jgi:hypothetical protein
VELELEIHILEFVDFEIGDNKTIGIFCQTPLPFTKDEYINKVGLLTIISTCGQCESSKFRTLDGFLHLTCRPRVGLSIYQCQNYFQEYLNNKEFAKFLLLK